MKTISFRATDGMLLVGTLFPGTQKRVVLINSATGVPRKIYNKFAQYLSSAGPTVITYDYRGIGDSRHRPLSKVEADMSDWATKDVQGVVNFINSEFPDHKISVVGHSFGGQCLGTLESVDRIDKVMMVGAQMGYWKLFPRSAWPKLISLWYGIVPALSHTLGYFPAKKLGLGEDLPKGVALEWRDWCCHPEYIFKAVGKKLPANYDQFRAPMTVFMPTDDEFASEAAVLKLMERYRNSEKKFVTLDPKDFGVKGIGHFGVFREEFKDKLWDQMKASLI